jgi:glycosyltransferase involved in cell wall biosynthesis
MRIVSLCTHVPFKGIRYSSGQFTLAWLSALSREADIELVVPATAVTLSAPRELPSNVEVTFVPVDRERRLLDRYHYNANGGVTPGRSVLSGFRASDKFEKAVAAADVVEIHMHHLLPLVTDVRRISERTPVTAIVHDVMTQKVAREAQLATGIKGKVGSYVRTRQAARREVQLINRLDHVLTFSAKDAALLMDLGITIPTEVIEPLVHLPELHDRPSVGQPPREPVVTFTGALFRSVNADSIRWFLDEVWPTVQTSVPEAKLVIAGADPPEGVRRRHSSTTVVTGYVDDLDSVYRDTSLFVAPLVAGAGVKFKVLDAMAYGLPVIATPIAAEGIVEEAGEECFAAVTADPAEMAERIEFFLRHSDAAADVGSRAREWVHEKFDFGQSAQRALASYARLAARSETSRARNDGGPVV